MTSTLPTSGYKYKVISASSVPKLHFKVRTCMNNSGWLCDGEASIAKDARGRKIFQQALVQQKPKYQLE